MNQMNRGLKWLAPHFFGWGGFSSGALLIVRAAGAPYSEPWLALFVLTNCVHLVMLEAREQQAGFQDPRKTTWDILSKCLPFLILAATAKWWWA